MWQSRSALRWAAGGVAVGSGVGEGGAVDVGVGKEASVKVAVGALVSVGGGAVGVISGVVA